MSLSNRRAIADIRNPKVGAGLVLELNGGRRSRTAGGEPTAVRVRWPNRVPAKALLVASVARCAISPKWGKACHEFRGHGLSLEEFRLEAMPIDIYNMRKVRKCATPASRLMVRQLCSSNSLHPIDTPPKTKTRSARY